MKKSELVATVAAKLERTHRDVEEVLEGIFETIAERAMEGEEVLTPIGKFKLKVTPEREGLNPRTGEKMTFGETRRLVFKSGRAYKLRGEPAPKKKSAKKK